MLLNTKQTCQLLDITEKTLYSWVDTNRLTKITQEGRNFFNLTDVLKMLPTVITVYNHKGGTGKTAITIAIAEYFEYAQKAKKILILDFDAQANSTKHFILHDKLYDPDQQIYSLADYFAHNKKLNDLIYHYNDTIDIIPAKIDLADLVNYDSKVLETDFSKEFFDVFKKYTMVIIDTPPAINMLSKFGLMLANFVVAPVLCDMESIWGLEAVIKLISTFRTFDRYIDYKGLINQPTRTAAIKESIKKQFQSKLPNNLFENVMPENVGFVERAVLRDNMFNNMDKDMKQKIFPLMEELERWIYDNRPIEE